MEMKPSHYRVSNSVGLDHWETRTIHTVIGTGAGRNVIPSNVLSISSRQDLVTGDHLPQLGDAKELKFQLLDMIFIRTPLANYHFIVPYAVTDRLSATMIIANEFLERHVRAMQCMEGIFITTSGTVRIIGRDRYTVEVTDAEFNNPKQNNSTPTGTAKDYMSQCAIRST